MNAYPPELLLHHFPCMLVAGLLPAQEATPSGPQSTDQTSSPESTRSTALAAEPNGDKTSNATTVASSPSLASADLAADTKPSSSSQASDEGSGSANPGGTEDAKSGTEPARVYPDLCKGLADVFTSRGTNVVWDPARGRSTAFHSVLVQPNMRLPPAKTRLSPRPTAAPASLANGTSAATTADGPSRSPSNSSKPLPSTSDAVASLAAMTPRSPLSPLHPAGPLFPDGLIAPIWARKHREMVPAVFMLFLCLAERPGGPGAEQTAESGALLRSQDEGLIRQISERKRSLTERGIKLTVVLLTSRGMLEDAQLEARLSYVRRSSGLDSKASLFVLTPVTKQELGEFVVSLHKALHESALDFYREHARRVRRKRARYPPPPSVIQPILSAATALQSKAVDLLPLSREGWIVRAEYKLATFAELQGENDEALQRYLEAYEVLSGPCLGSTMMLPPRTKRWAEAKVLADTLSIKISKFHLYRDDGAAAIKQLQRHLHRFTELSTGWGIGSMTFEYWSWLCKQYRMFADLMEAATRNPGAAPLPPFALPAHAPPLPSRLLHPDVLPLLQAGKPVAAGMLTPNQTAIMTGASPAALIQGPGSFHYLAALCTLERRDRFKKLVATEQLSAEDVAKHPSLSHEQKVDYTGQITEQLTRAYDCFKRAKLARFSLLIASRIALTYLEGGKHEMALRFLERILRSYRAEGCVDIQSWLTQLAAGCADHVGDVASSIRILFDLLSPRLDVPDAERRLAAERLALILKGDDEDGGETKGPVRIDADLSNGLLSVDSVFIEDSVEVGTPVAFQLRLSASKGSRLEAIAFDSLELTIAGFERPLVIRADEMGEQGTEIVDLGQLSNAAVSAEHKRGLSWRAGSTKALQGTIVSSIAGTLEFTSVTLRAGGSKAATELVFDLSAPTSAARVCELHDPRWLIKTPTGKHRFVAITQREKASAVRIRPRTYRLEVSTSLSPADAAYLDEHFPVVLQLTNQESFALSCSAYLALQAAYEGMDDTLHCDGSDAAPSAQVREHDCGVVQPGQTARVPFTLKAARREGERIVDVVVRCRPAGETEGTTAQQQASSEQTLSIRVPVVPAFSASFAARWTPTDPKREKRRTLLDFDDSESSEDDDSSRPPTDDEDAADAAQQPRRRDAYPLPLPLPREVEGAPAPFSTQQRRRRVRIETRLEMRGGAAVEVHALELQMSSGLPTLRLDGERFDAAVEYADLLGRWEEGDSFGLSYSFSLRPTPPSSEGGGMAHRPASSAGRPAAAYIELSWSRTTTTTTSSSAENNTAGENGGERRKNTTLLALPTSVFAAPTQTEVIVTPTFSHLATLNLPFPLSLHLENTTTRTSNLVVLVESSEAFVFAGPRQLSIPHLLPGEKRRVQAWTLVPLRLGRCQLPRISVVRRRSRPSGERGKEEGKGVEEEGEVLFSLDGKGAGVEVVL